jgi:hypothetical protein
MPLDRKHPKQGTIPIYFELYLHSGSGPAESAILVNFGGPGPATSGQRSSALYVFGPNLDTHDLLLSDGRARGLSGTINCKELQHGLGHLIKRSLIALLNWGMQLAATVPATSLRIPTQYEQRSATIRWTTTEARTAEPT